MKKAEYHERGPVPRDVIEAVDFELADPGPDEALVEVLAAPINPSDVLTLTGQYGSLPPLPAIGGNEGVGVVRAVGGSVQGLKPGQRVLLPIGEGTWRTHLIAPAQSLIALPEGGDDVQMSMLAINPPTASLLLDGFETLEKGDWVIQNAANSAVGTYLVQLARHRGLRTVNLVRRDAARKTVEDAGAEIVLVDGDDIAARVRTATDGGKIRLGIDAVGGEATERLAQCLANRGKVVNYGAMSGDACQLSPASLIFRDISLRGFWLSRWLRESPPAKVGALFAGLAPLIADGTLHTAVAQTFPIERIKDAIAAACRGERGGKIVLVPNG